MMKGPASPSPHHPSLRHAMRTASLLVVVVFSSLACGADLTMERDIRPIFKEHCYDCHGATKDVEGGLDLRLVRFMQRGGESGPAIVAGKPDESYLLQRITSGEMPPSGKKVPAEQIAVLERWISAGAPTSRPEPETLDEGLGITPEERAFWSLQPIARPTPKSFGPMDRVRTPIDALLLEKIRESGISGFSPDADRRTLIKRVYFDLIGLPPTPEEVEAFASDSSPHAYEGLVDRLLNSPHYGERWGRHWLDIAGYADSEGYTEKDADRSWAYFYRDYVIRSFNTDKPLDQFIQEQLAGDEMVPPRQGDLTPEQIERLTATGFLRMPVDGTGSGANDDTARNQTMADTIKLVSTSLLGLSVGCAQCHDHRYDPIPQKDYYALRAIFEPALNYKSWRTPQQRLVSLYTEQDRKDAAKVEEAAQQIAKERGEKQKQYIEEALQKELQKHPEAMRAKLEAAYRVPASKRTDEQKQLLKKYPSVNISSGTLYQYNQKHADDLKAYDKRIAETRAKKPVERYLRVLTEPGGKLPETRLFHRGEFKQPKDVIAPAALTVATPPGRRRTFADTNDALPTSGRRLAFACWLTSGEHPLVSRVLANRIWMHHFGRGIVGTPADFGVLGERPTHPRLLDYLASELVSNGWSMKSLHKLIMTSTVYRQSSVADPAKLAAEGANRVYWKWPVQRLDAEIVRDRILATSGVLGSEMYGPPVNLTADDAGQIIVDGDETRRSVYIRVKRTQPVAMLKAFDAPVMEVNCERRPSSTAAPQSLMLMNSKFILRHAEKFAARAKAEPADDAKLESQVDFDLARLSNPFSWQFGYGVWDDENKQLNTFTPLPFWTGSQWQGQAKLPDPQLGFVFLNAAGGHPGSKHAAVRRWIASRSGELQIDGALSHPSENGDGVRATILSSRHGLVGQWTAAHGSTTTTSRSFEVQAGDTIDFVVDCRASVTSDSFAWPVRLAVRKGGSIAAPNSEDGFHGPAADVQAAPGQVIRAWQLAYCRPPTAAELTSALEFLESQLRHLQSHGKGEAVKDPMLAAMTNLCHVLLSSNEFLYVE